MMRRLLFLLALSLSVSAHGEPRVVVSIGPIHSLVAGVMEGVAEPELLIPAGASPHTYSLKPSDARALSRADLVVWVGPELEAVLGRPLHTLAGNAQTLALLEVAGMELLPAREAGRLHKEEEKGGHGEGDGHRHGDVDTHLWLSPHNARRLAAAVAEQLAGLDPENAGRYRSNAEALDGDIVQLEQELGRRLAPLKGQRYIVFHDAYRYFEKAFELHPAGAIAVSPEKRPGARRIIEIRQAIRESGARCVFSEPQFRPDIVDVVLEDSGARHGVLDPLGVGLPPGKEQWFKLMQGLADNLSACLAGDS